MRGGQRGEVDVAQGEERGQRAGGGVLRHAQVRLLRGGWTGVGFEEFAAPLDRYIEWYRVGKLKKALGWRTIRQAREELAGVA